jgi:exopolyphosphatase/guanosine-5'-triphosphate,3'-diphosphate pyrophosphatase
MRCACIDIGSNTTRLLVAERDPADPAGLREVRTQRTFVRLSADERQAGIGADKLAALADAVAEQARAAAAEGVAPHHLRVVATAALRDAPGREAVVARLGVAAGVPVEVLSAAEEAELAFAGATAGLDPSEGTVAVVDMGGGSTELAVGVPGSAVEWWTSLPLGSGALAEAHLTADPPSRQQLAQARAVAEAAVAAAQCRPATRAWVVGGSTASLRRVTGGRLDTAALDAALDALCERPAAQIALELGLHVERARLLPAGLLLLTAVTRALGCPLGVGRGGMREGVVLALLTDAR